MYYEYKFIPVHGPIWVAHTTIMASVTIGLTYGGYSNYGVDILRLHISPLTLLVSTTPTNTYWAFLSNYLCLHHLPEFGCDYEFYL
jgi:hypothetical protein